ncbi:uncharacterized protein [Onthophagus taurus]|uniref:uncharacterized protein isoform X3 n=1 Tax=Onthophagus taurus TaxID=166361 RepID=UPI0039BDE576
MSVSPFLRPLGIVAAILGTIQGLVWTILTILVIVIRTEGWRPVMGEEHMFSELIYNVIFFPEQLNLDNDMIMNADVFMGFAAFYLPLSFLWSIVSLTLLWALWYKLWEYTRWCLFAWCAIGGILTVFDFILVILFSVDYALINELFAPNYEAVFKIQVVIGSVMAITARGFAIMVLNGIFSVVFMIWALNINAEDYGGPKLTMSPYSRWHTTGSIPRVPMTLQNDNFTKNQNHQNANLDVVQMRFHPSRQVSVDLNNQVHNSLNNQDFNRPPSVEPDYLKIPHFNDDRERDNRRFTKVLPSTPPKAVLRPNSRYY